MRLPVQSENVGRKGVSTRKDTNVVSPSCEISSWESDGHGCMIHWELVDEDDEYCYYSGRTWCV
jgi:hypothetical protein